MTTVSVNIRQPRYVSELLSGDTIVVPCVIEDGSPITCVELSEKTDFGTVRALTFVVDRVSPGPGSAYTLYAKELYHDGHTKECLLYLPKQYLVTRL